MDNIRKSFRKIFLTAMSAASVISVQSCLDDNNGYDMSLYYPDAIVTVKPLDDGGFYMQLDEQTTLTAVNMDESPYDEPTRAFVNFSYADVESGDYDRAVTVNWFRDILTKDMVQVPEDVTDLDAEYGSDPVEIMKSWMTAIEDGYFTIHFQTLTSGTGKQHKVNLVQPDPDDPYVLEFRHDADGDNSGVWAWGVVAFRLSAFGFVPGEEVSFTLKWNAYGKEKTHVFKYTPGDAVASQDGTGESEMPGTSALVLG